MFVLLTPGVGIHDFEQLIFCIKKRRGKNALPFFGAEDEIICGLRP